METHTLILNAQESGKIENLSLYAQQAQLTRVFRHVSVVAGQNRLRVFCLPNVINHDSIRVECRGPVMIKGVTVSRVDKAVPAMTSPLLEQLCEKRTEAESALQRCEKVLMAIDTYIGKLDIEHLYIAKLGEAMDVYNTTQGSWDIKIAQLKKQLEKLKEDIEQEEKRLKHEVPSQKLRTEAVVDLFGREAGEAEIILIYAVSHCGWTAKYDVRVNTQEISEPAGISYKAGITQQTGETWTNAPITLETSRPVLGAHLPHLQTWNISYMETRMLKGFGMAARKSVTVPDENNQLFEVHESADISSTGNVVATYTVPGETTIPSNDDEHTVTIAELDLDVVLSWRCIPTCDTRVHMMANIKNSSDYTLLSGETNVYVDGSFIAISNIEDVSPGETFNCLLGVDPSIRVTYPWRTEKVSETGFYNKSQKRTFTQQITIHNTKPVDVKGVTISDHIPVSQDANITVNLIKPALRDAVSTALKSAAAPPEVQVANGVVARWTASETPGADESTLGQDGKVNWVCGIPAHEKVTVILQWEVLATQKAQIRGL